MRIAVKICGLTRPEHVVAACEAGADAIGLVFADGSPRTVTPEQAVPLLAAVRPGVARVGVFRRFGAAEARAVADLPLDLVQAAPPAHTGTRVFLPALNDGPDLEAQLSTLETQRALDSAATPPPGRLEGAVLVDGRVSGSGEAADWDRIAGLATRVPLVLAGGLDPDNVADAIRRVQPHGVDVSSGVESTRGLKDTARIRAFIEAVRAQEES